ncbi:unnamed protein product [Moneuplotes crassus]|uniref:Uncharacterized protein n=1 Tax=Euplotes crassus TaxID=5936 RepID=A0AAD2D594_EUPCR|nr:unnamed protein product [Moneuplotes crassus]
MSEGGKKYDMTHEEYLRGKLTQLVSDLEDVRGYYREAEKIYSYKNLEGPTDGSEQDLRANQRRFGVRVENANELSRGSFSYGLFFALVGSKLFARKALLDFSCYTAYPARTLSLFFYGVGAACFINLSKIQEDETFIKDHHFKRRVEENRRAEGVIENIKHKVDAAINIE